MEAAILSHIQLWIIFIVSISLHEYAHAASSYALGDPTPKIQWRLTPNPFKHIDPIGFILVFLIGFGRGRAVQIDPSYYKKPYRDELLVALAGPATNILLGIGAIVVLFGYNRIAGVPLMESLDLVSYFWLQFALINFALAAFNMIPLPPLDGYRLIKVLHHEAGAFLERHVMIISVAFLFLIVIGPFKWLLHSYISGVAEGLFRLFALPLGSLFW